MVFFILYEHVKNLLHTDATDTFALLLGELAQLVERLHGMQEVSGSNPLFSTSFRA